MPYSITLLPYIHCDYCMTTASAAAVFDETDVTCFSDLKSLKFELFIVKFSCCGYKNTLKSILT